MRFLRHFRFLLVGWTFLAFAALEGFATDGGTDDQLLSPPVENLRQALKTPIKDPANPEDLEIRRKEVTKRIEAIHRLGDLVRALQLHEWYLEDLDEKVKEINQPLRAAVAEKFEKKVRETLQRGNALSRIATANLLADMGTTVRGTGANLGGAARPLAPDLIQSLKDKDPDVRAAAARALGKVNPEAESAVKGLSELLADDTAVRQAAAAALADLVREITQIFKLQKTPGVSASRTEFIDVCRIVVPAAGRGMTNTDPLVRRKSAEAVQLAALALWEMVSEPMPREMFAPEGRKWNKEEEQEVEVYRKQVESELNDVKPLIEALKKQSAAMTRIVKDPQPEVRLAARRALEEIGNARLRQVRRAASVPRLPQEKERKVEDPLLELLTAQLPALEEQWDGADARVRLATLDDVEMLGEEAVLAMPMLVKALSDSNHFVRWSATRILGKTGGKTGKVEPEVIIHQLARLLDDPDLDVKKGAAAALERFGPAAKASLPALLRVLAQGDVEMRLEAIHAVVGIGGEQPGSAAWLQPAIPALAAALNDSDPRVRQLAAEALGRFGPAARDAELPLRRLLDSQEPKDRKAASEALLNIL